MGTSSSHGGIKPAAEKEINITAKRPDNLDPQPFRSFRVNLGKFAKENDNQYLKNALASYAKTAKGGSLSAFAPVISKVAEVVSTFLSQNISIELKNGKPVVSFINKLEGLTVDEAVDLIIRELCPQAGVPGNELARQPADEALSKILEIPEAMTPSELIDIFLREYLTNVVFGSLEFDFGSSFSSDDPESLIKAEEKMKDYVHSIVESSLLSVIGTKDLSSITSGEVQRIVNDLIISVLNKFQSEGMSEG
jgi:hypothetical protein